MAKEEEAMTPRPYVTMLGAVLLWLGIILHLLPFCDILALIFPGLQFFHGMCWLFVIAVTLVISAAAVLLTVGLIWSCTRGWAALVLVALGLSGELSVIGGSVWLLVWAISAVGVLYLYFKFLPDYLLETDGQRHSLLQDLGNWFVPEHASERTHTVPEHVSIPEPQPQSPNPESEGAPLLSPFLCALLPRPLHTLGRLPKPPMLSPARPTLI
jgi:hypothetical protein